MASQNQIAHLFRIGKVVEKSATDKKSEVWKSFMLLHYADGTSKNDYANYVKCKICETGSDIQVAVAPPPSSGGATCSFRWRHF